MNLQTHPLYDIAQFVADSEPTSAAHEAIRVHLAQCDFCRGFAERLRRTETALKCCPVISADATLRTDIARIIVEDQAQAPQWRLLPWTVWLPAGALVAATITMLLLAPAGGATSLSIELEPVLVLPEMFQGLESASMHLSNQSLYIIGGALASILGGAGLLWALSSLSPEQNKELDNLGSRVSDGANRLLHPRHS